MENMVELSRDLFLNEQDICSMASQLAKEMYKKHDNDVQNVQMWAVENKDKFSFTKKIVFKLKAILKVVTCPSPLGYKPNGKGK